MLAPDAKGHCPAGQRYEVVAGGTEKLLPVLDDPTWVRSIVADVAPLLAPQVKIGVVVVSRVLSVGEARANVPGNIHEQPRLIASIQMPALPVSRVAGMLLPQ